MICENAFNLAFAFAASLISAVFVALFSSIFFGCLLISLWDRDPDTAKLGFVFGAIPCIIFLTMLIFSATAYYRCKTSPGHPSKHPIPIYRLEGFRHASN